MFSSMYYIVLELLIGKGQKIVTDLKKFKYKQHTGNY